MKILVASDGSACSKTAVDVVCNRPWPAGTQVLVLSAGYVGFPTKDGETWDLAEADQAAARVSKAAARRIHDRAPGLTVDAKSFHGEPKRAILDEAESWGADLIVVGSHGHGPATRFLLGSVSQAVALHAPCSVEIVRCRNNGPEDRGERASDYSGFRGGVVSSRSERTS